MSSWVHEFMSDYDFSRRHDVPIAFSSRCFGIPWGFRRLWSNGSANCHWQCLWWKQEVQPQPTLDRNQRGMDQNWVQNGWLIQNDTKRMVDAKNRLKSVVPLVLVVLMFDPSSYIYTRTHICITCVYMHLTSPLSGLWKASTQPDMALTKSVVCYLVKT